MSSNTIDYTEEAKKLNTEQKERLLSRMSGKLPKRLEKEKLTELEALAKQLELEDKQLAEWKERVAAIRAKEKKKNK
jgi:cation transport regulator ChaC